MPRVTSRTKTVLLALIAVGWLFLSAANFAKSRLGVGALYLVLAAATVAIAVALQRARRAP